MLFFRKSCGRVLQPSMTRVACLHRHVFRLFPAAPPAHALFLLAEVELLDVLTFEQVVTRTIHDHAAHFHHVSALRHTQCRIRVLLDQQDGQPLLTIQAPDNLEDLGTQELETGQATARPGAAIVAAQ